MGVSEGRGGPARSFECETRSNEERRLRKKARPSPTGRTGTRKIWPVTKVGPPDIRMRTHPRFSTPACDVFFGAGLMQEARTRAGAKPEHPATKAGQVHSTARRSKLYI